MNAKPVLGLVLGAFVIVAVIVVLREPARPTTAAAPAAIRAAAIPPAAAPAATEAPPQVPPAAGPAMQGEPVRAAETSVGPLPVKRKRARAASPATKEVPAAPAVSTLPPPSPQHRVVAMYFHGDIRCATCRKVEAYAKEAVEQGFAEQVRSGLVEFRAVNVDQPVNRHFIQDYQLTNKSVVVVDEVDGAVARWVKLDNVWGLVGNRDAYLLYVQDAVRAYVEN